MGRAGTGVKVQEWCVLFTDEMNTAKYSVNAPFVDATRDDARLQKSAGIKHTTMSAINISSYPTYHN